MGIFFSDKKPRVTREELKKVRQSLFNRGLKEREINFLDGLFSSDMDEKSELDRGIQREEIEAHIEWLRRNSKMHTLTDKEIGIVEEEFLERL